MRQQQVATASALAVVMLAILGVTVINATSSKDGLRTPVVSMDVTQMIRGANDLPIEQFDAY